MLPAIPLNTITRKLNRRPKRRPPRYSLLYKTRSFVSPMDDPPHSLALVPSRRSHSRVPFREDCWSEEATRTLIEAWGDHYLELNRGNLRQKHWQEVADAVNAEHGHTKRTRRTDIQCKNRIDTLKKKYKIEKSRVSATNSYPSPWPFFERLDLLIGPASTKKSAPAVARLIPDVRRGSGYSGFQLASPVPVAPRSASVKRLPASVDGSSFRRSAIAAEAAAAEKEAEDSDETVKSRSSYGRSAGRGGELEDGDYKELAQAIAAFAEIYERVEGSKQRQMVELEKQRMQFAKEMEIQRMELLVDMQLQFERSKRPKRQSDGADENYS